MNTQSDLLAAPRVPLRYLVRFNLRPIALDSDESCYLPMDAISNFGGVDSTRMRPTAELAQGYSFIAEGDVAYAKVTPCFENGKGLLATGLPGGYAFATTEITVMRPCDELDSRYLAWILQSEDFRGPGMAHMSGAGGLKRVPEAYAAQYRVPHPTLDVQRAIADYLDRETAQIDAFIAKNEELIALLTERRASQIALAVSRGIDASPQLVDANKLALGTMPAHWSLTPLKRAVGYQEGPGIMAADFRDAGVPLLRISSVNTATATLEGCNFLDPDLVRDRWSHFQVAMGDLLISASASMGTIAEVATDDVVGAVPYTGIIRISPGKMLREFAKWFFISEEFLMQVEALKTGSTIQHFGPSHLGQMWVALPPPSEQRAIAARLRLATAGTNESIRTAERGVALARERRAALISAAVTGKIDVGVAA